MILKYDKALAVTAMRFFFSRQHPSLPMAFKSNWGIIIHSGRCWKSNDIADTAHLPTRFFDKFLSNPLLLIRHLSSEVGKIAAAVKVSYW